MLGKELPVGTILPPRRKKSWTWVRAVGNISQMVVWRRGKIALKMLPSNVLVEQIWP